MGMNSECKMNTCEYSLLEERVFRNPHFRETFPILEVAGVDAAAFMANFRDELMPLLDEHRTDSEVLRPVPNR